MSLPPSLLTQLDTVIAGNPRSGHSSTAIVAAARIFRTAFGSQPTSDKDGFEPANAGPRLAGSGV